jgi:hypothetical protein
MFFFKLVDSLGSGSVLVDVLAGDGVALALGGAGASDLEAEAVALETLVLLALAIDVIFPRIIDFRLSCKVAHIIIILLLISALRLRCLFRVLPGWLPLPCRLSASLGQGFGSFVSL